MLLNAFPISAVSCDPPIQPTNGNYTGGTQYQNKVTFHCNHGYTLSGSNTTTCQADRTWTNGTPNCTGMYCNHLFVHLYLLYFTRRLLTIWQKYVPNLVIQLTDSINHLEKCTISIAWCITVAIATFMQMHIYYRGINDMHSDSFACPR